MTQPSDRYVNLLKVSITVLLFALAKVKPLVTQNKVEKGKITDTFGRCQTAMKDWLANSDVIGGSFFGGALYRSYIYGTIKSTKASLELKVLYIYL